MRFKRPALVLALDFLDFRLSLAMLPANRRWRIAPAGVFMLKSDIPRAFGAR
jgi:hypothetical protein